MLGPNETKMIDAATLAAWLQAGEVDLYDVREEPEFAAGRIPTIKANYLLVRNIDVCGLQIGDYRKRRPDLTAKCFDELYSLYEAGKIKPPPTTILPIGQCVDALRAIRDRTARGRIVLVQDRVQESLK